MSDINGIDYDITLGSTGLIDALGSVVVNLNATGSTNYQWLSNETVQGYGPPGDSLGGRIPHVNSVAYKIKFMDQVHEHDNNNAFLGDAACYNNPETCNGRGPFRIFGRRYYIDFMFLYFRNTGTVPLYSPTYTVEEGRCDENYGYFIGTPLRGPNTDASVGQLLTRPPKYSNDLGALTQTALYKLTPNANEDGSQRMTVNLTVPNIVQAVQNTILYGQSPVVAEDLTRVPIALQGERGAVPGEYHPLILFRYVSENAPTSSINFSFRYGAHVG